MLAGRLTSASSFLKGGAQLELPSTGVDDDASGRDNATGSSRHTFGG
jgi:hypothetical protein